MTRLLMALWLLAAGTIPSVSPALAGEDAGEGRAPRDGVFIHVSHGYDDLHRFLMALKLGAMMVEDRDVLIYFDIEAVKPVLRDAEDVSLDHFPSARELLQKLRESGAILMACPGCLKVIGKSAADLAEGIEIADWERFFTFTKGRILSIDY